MAAIFQNGYQNDHQNPEAGIFPFIPMYLDMQHIKFYFFDIIKFKFCTKNFKMAAVFKMAAKMHKFLFFNLFCHAVQKIQNGQNGCQNL